MAADSLISNIVYHEFQKRSIFYSSVIPIQRSFCLKPEINYGTLRDIIPNVIQLF